MIQNSVRVNHSSNIRLRFVALKCASNRILLDLATLLTNMNQAFMFLDGTKLKTIRDLL